MAGGINTFGYALQNPLIYTDPYRLAPDALIDLGLIAYDLASLAYNKFRGCDTSTDEASLAANVTGLLIPGITGLGLGVRAAGKVNQPKLQRIHSDETLNSGSNKFNLESQRTRSTKDIIDSLKPGASEPLKVKPDGRIFDGNTRIKVLEERGVDVGNLPRTIID